jgi:hypothetical protein
MSLPPGDVVRLRMPTSSLKRAHAGHHVRAIRALDRSRRQGRQPAERVERSESLDEGEASARINDVMAADILRGES